MGREQWGMVTGVAVLVTGVLTLIGLLVAPDRSAVEETSSPRVESSSQGGAATVAELPGVGPAATRLLYSSGQVGFAGKHEMAQLPPSVSRVLIEYGVPLRVPNPSEAVG